MLEVFYVETYQGERWLGLATSPLMAFTTREAAQAWIDANQPGPTMRYAIARASVYTLENVKAW